LIDPYEEYKLKYNEGDTLKLDINKKWNIEKFDAVIGNPPYNNKQNNSGKRGGGDSLWNKFVIRTINKWISKNGYIIYVHPSGWRKPESERSKYKDMFKIMTHNKQMIYLEIHGLKDGLKIFKCGTRYDWYIIKNCSNNNKTIIKDEKGIVKEIDMLKFKFLPNYEIGMIKKILVKENERNCDVLFSNSAYETRKKWMSKKQDKEFKYSCIHSTPKNETIYWYSSINNNGFFGISKIIFGESGINDVIIDMKGEYGMTQEAIGIKINTLNEGINIKKCIESDKFKQLLNACSWSNFRIDWRMFKYFKKDFWKEFI
jgi:hypothetical protein